MESLIQDLLDYAQIKAGKFRLNLTYFNLKNTVEEVFSILEQKAFAKNIIIENEFENLSFDMIYHDEQRIK